MKQTSIWLVLLLAVLAALPVQAATFVMMSDEALVDLAPAIFDGRVVSVDSSPAPGLPSTDYGVEVDRVLKGSVPGSTLIVRVPGGVGPDGLGFHVYGAPRFETGDRVLLFVSPADDGTFRLYQLMLGAFVERRAFGERLAVRFLAEAREVEVPGRERTEEQQRRERGLRKLEELALWITDRVQGRHRDPDYFFEPPRDPDGLRNQAEGFTLFLDPVDGERIRWFLFEEDGTAFFRIHQDGQPGLTLQQLETAVRRGLNAWSTIPGTDIRYDFAGTTTSTNGLRQFGSDGINAVIAEDPNGNPRFGGPYSCLSGGVLAVGGPWYRTAPEPGPDGEPFHRIAEGEVITNKNIACFFEDSIDTQAAADELFTHELGHTLGIGHSCGDALSGACDTELENEAIMRATIHDDGRGARLNDDDRAAARALYASDDPGGPGGPKVPMPSELLAPGDLTALPLSATEVQLDWNDNSTDETGYTVEMRSAQPGGFQIVQTVGADTDTVVISDLDPATPYTFQVKATRDEKVSGPSPEANATTQDLVEGPCAADDLTVCLIEGRFRVRAQWRDAVSGDSGFGHAIEVPGSDLTGLFWFFDEANIELVVKTLDARIVNEHFWNFYGALSSVEYWISVTDTDDGESVTYHNPQNEICGFPDTQAFRRPPPAAAMSAAASRAAPATVRGLPGAGTTGECVPSATTLCLLENRFRVEVEWDNSARSGEADDRGGGRVRPVTAVETDETGFFWFFDPENVELVVKVLDARVINDHFWVFYGALSDVEYRIIVTDTETGNFLTFDNELGDFCGDAETEFL